MCFQEGALFGILNGFLKPVYIWHSKVSKYASMYKLFDMTNDTRMRNLIRHCCDSR